MFSERFSLESRSSFHSTPGALRSVGSGDVLTGQPQRHVALVLKREPWKSQPFHGRASASQRKRDIQLGLCPVLPLARLWIFCHVWPARWGSASHRRAMRGGLRALCEAQESTRQTRGVCSSYGTIGGGAEASGHSLPQSFERGFRRLLSLSHWALGCFSSS